MTRTVMIGLRGCGGLGGGTARGKYRIWGAGICYKNSNASSLVGISYDNS